MSLNHQKMIIINVKYGCIGFAAKIMTTKSNNPLKYNWGKILRTLLVI